MEPRFPVPGSPFPVPAFPFPFPIIRLASS